MKAFLREQLYNMVKLFLNQIALTVFGTVLAIATSKNDSLLLASSIFSVLFFLALNYTTCWEIGAKDKIRVDSGRLESMQNKGLYISFGANLPNLIIALLIGLGVLIGTDASQSMSFVFNAIARLLNGMYLGIIKIVQDAASVTSITQVWWWFIVITLPSMLVGWLAYYLGSKNIRLLSFIGIKPKPDSANRK
ncbi:MAG: hypothetical protein IJF48_04265 [Clostridia bacterium]|nr:hypothetical protein [Clostridia bacterium]